MAGITGAIRSSSPVTASAKPGARPLHRPSLSAAQRLTEAARACDVVGPELLGKHAGEIAPHTGLAER